MSSSLVTVIAVTAALLAVAAILLGVIHNKIKNISRTVFGTDSLSEGIENQKKEMSETPRSLHSMTSVYLPQIHKDFPEFDYELYKNKTQALLRSFFAAVARQDIKLLKEECSQTLKNSVQGVIEDLSDNKSKRFYENTVIYDTQIARYIKSGATVTIQFVTSLSYLGYTVDKNENVVNGSNEIRQQTVYETDLVYVQDADKANKNATGYGVTCPNCGAPVKNLGNKFCEYCGSAVTEINIRAWTFDSVNEQTVSKRQF